MGVGSVCYRGIELEVFEWSGKWGVTMRFLKGVDFW